MTIEMIRAWMEANPQPAFVGVLFASAIVFLIARFLVARGLHYIAERTENRYDDIIVASLRPFRIAYLAPLFVIYAFAYLLPEAEELIQDVVLFSTLWVLIVTLSALLNAINTIYESRKSFSGVPIQGYLDLVKLLLLVVGIILSISLITNESPIILLSGLGALTAVLLLIFRDTLLSLVASVQISANDLVKEGDWIEVASYDADGVVINMSLHSVMIQNWDKTITVIPTYKLMEVSFKNWRGMSESGGRRIKRSIHIDLNSVRLLTEKDLQRLSRINLIRDYVTQKRSELQSHITQYDIDNSVPVNVRRPSNVGTFRAYVEAYLHQHSQLHQQGMTLLVRQLAPGPQGLPIEIYAFTTTIDFAAYEDIQADIFDHLISVVPEFDLRVFQEPTGDFSVLNRHYGVDNNSNWMNDRSSISTLKRLLDQASSARHDFEQIKSGGEYYKDWPKWFAAYLLKKGLGDLVARQPETAELAETLIRITKEHQDVEDQSWSAFAAHRLVEQYGESK